MDISDLPDDILVLIFSNFLGPKDLINLTRTCRRFEQIIEDYNICMQCLKTYPFVDMNYPYGKKSLLLIRLIFRVNFFVPE